MEDEAPGSLPKVTTLHAHRLDHNPSKLPAFRFADLKQIKHQKPSIISATLLTASPDLEATPTLPDATKQGTSSSGDYFHDACTTTSANPIPSRESQGRPSTSPQDSTCRRPVSDITFVAPAQTSTSGPTRLSDRRGRRAPASHSSNGIATQTGPPPALSTQRSFAAESARPSSRSTSEWALEQQKLVRETFDLHKNLGGGESVPTQLLGTSRQTRGATRSLDETTLSRPVIPPIRSFRASKTRPGSEMYRRNSQRSSSSENGHSEDRDRTLRALEGFASREVTSDQDSDRPGSYEDRGQDDTITEDLFLNLAQDDMSRRAATLEKEEGGHVPERRISRKPLASHRQSLPPSSSVFESAILPPVTRSGSDLLISQTHRGVEASPEIQRMDRTVYRPASRERPPISGRYNGDVIRSRHISQVMPLTPNSTGGGVLLYESAPSTASRHGGVTDHASRLATRGQSSRPLDTAYSTSRTYDSSPLALRNTDLSPERELPHVVEGTASTASTTAPSTVWDELDDLKSRMRKLELTARLPATSGAAVSNATGERPPTATTTNTTLSTSPKRSRGLSTSPAESLAVGAPTDEAHPLLRAALSKTKPFLPGEVFKALEATASDALSMSAMTGASGHPIIHSSAQSTIGTAAVATDRQLRRKAESMCQSLTELCLALSEVQSSQQPATQTLPRPGSRDVSSRDEPEQRASTSMAAGSARVKSSPRGLSRLEARRTSMLAQTALPTPRFGSQDSAQASPQSGLAGRRTSLLYRGRRNDAEELDEGDAAAFRAPSRANTDIGRTVTGLRNAPRHDSLLQQPPDGYEGLRRAPSVQSSLPVRRHYGSGSLTNSPSTPIFPDQRRYLERATPERDTNGMINRLAEERGQRQIQQPSGLLSFESRNGHMGRTGSLLGRDTTGSSHNNNAAPRRSNFEIAPAGQGAMYE